MFYVKMHFMKKNNFHHGNLKSEFLRISFDFISKNDVEKLTLKILSEETGTSRSSIYKHFSSKNALIEAIIIEALERFDTLIVSVFSDKDTPLVDKFYIAGKKYLEFAQDNPNLYRLLFGPKYAHIREEIINIQDDEDSGFGALRLAVEEGQSLGAFKDESAFARAVIIWSSLHGLSSLCIDGFMDVNKELDALYELLFTSLLDATLSSKAKIISNLPFLKNMLKHS